MVSESLILASTTRHRLVIIHFFSLVQMLLEKIFGAPGLRAKKIPAMPGILHIKRNY